MAVTGTDPFVDGFEGWTASEMSRSVVHSIFNSLLRQAHEVPLWNDLIWTNRFVLQGLVQEVSYMWFARS